MEHVHCHDSKNNESYSTKSVGNNISKVGNFKFECSSGRITGLFGFGSNSNLHDKPISPTSHLPTTSQLLLTTPLALSPTGHRPISRTPLSQSIHIPLTRDDLKLIEPSDGGSPIPRPLTLYFL
jgi:hypothetical protein